MLRVPQNGNGHARPAILGEPMKRIQPETGSFEQWQKSVALAPLTSVSQIQTEDQILSSYGSGIL